MIGELFGMEGDFYEEMRSHYLENLDFKEKDILEAMRYFLTFLELPGEGQKLERILESFAKKYNKDNVGLY